MKLSELFKKLNESPYSLEGDATKKFGQSWCSYENYARTFREIGNLQVNKNSVRIGVHRQDEKVVRGYIDSHDGITGEPALKLVFCLQFKTNAKLDKIPDELRNKKILQVEYVETSTEIETNRCAPFTYMILAQDGYTVISDDTQFNGGIGLWKRIAKDAGFVDMKVSILNTNGTFKRDGNDEIEIYNGRNIPDAEIWTSGWDFTGQNILLVLSYD